MTAPSSSELPYISVDREAQRFRVNRDCYKSPEVFEKEREIIFNKCWLYLGHCTELPNKGDFVTRKVGGRQLIFTHSKDGELRAFFNSCTHRGATVCRESRGCKKSFTCCYHGWIFGNDGKLKSVNAEQGFPEGFAKDGSLDLRQVPRIENYRGFYFVNFNPRAISLADYLADAKDCIDALCDQSDSEMYILPGEHSYSIKANYKYLVENSSDGYHLLPVHESYFDFMTDQYKGTAQEGAVEKLVDSYYDSGQTRCLGMGHAILESMVPTPRPVGYWVEAWGPEAKQEIDATREKLESKFGRERMEYICETQKNLIIFPNLIINDIMSITVRYIEPESYNFMKVTAWALGPRDESPLLRSLRLDNFVSFLGPAGFGSPDDVEMLELCQTGAEGSPIEWSELSKGMSKDADLLTQVGGPADEVQFQGFYTQWDRVIRNVESLELPADESSEGQS